MSHTRPVAVSREGVTTVFSSTQPETFFLPCSCRGLSFHRLVDKYAYVQSGALETIVRPWMKKRDDVANELSNKLPGDRRLSDDHFDVISAANPLGRIHKVPTQDYMPCYVLRIPSCF